MADLTFKSPDTLCFVCGGDAETDHHLKPKRLKGKNRNNLLPLCLTCHGIVDTIEPNIDTVLLAEGNCIGWGRLAFLIVLQIRHEIFDIKKNL